MSVIKCLLGLLCVSVLCLSGCSDLNPEEEKLVGTYQFVETETQEATEEDPAMEFSLDATVEYKRNRTSEMSGTMKILIELEYPDDDYYNVLTFEFSVNGRGKWSVSNGRLTEVTDAESLKIEMIQSSAAGQDEVAAMSIRVFKEYMGMYVAQIRKEILENDPTSTIRELTDRKLVLLDANGEEETCYRIR